MGEGRGWRSASAPRFEVTSEVGALAPEVLSAPRGTHQHLQSLLPRASATSTALSRNSRKTRTGTPRPLPHRLPHYRNRLPQPRLDRRYEWRQLEDGRFKRTQLSPRHRCPSLAICRASRRPIRSHISQCGRRPARRRPHPRRPQSRGARHHRQQRPHRPRAIANSAIWPQSRARSSSSSPR